MANGLVNGTFKKDRPPTQGPVVGRVKREYRYYKALLDDPRTPTAAKWLIGGGVGYLVLPFDLIPDFIPIIGKLDDMLITSALIGLGVRLVPQKVRAEDRSRSRRIRRVYGQNSVGSVLFESSALPGPFGIQINTCGRDSEIQGPVLFPLLDLMYEYGLVVVTGRRSGEDRFDDYTFEHAITDTPERCQTQVELDINFRPLPLVAAIAYYDSEVDGQDCFINTYAAYAALPTALHQTLLRLRLRWQPCRDICVDAVLKSDEPSSAPQEGALAVSGPQFLNLLMTDECSVAIDMMSNDVNVDELLTQVRNHMMSDVFCYNHPSSTRTLVAWNPRQILRVAAENNDNKPHYVYPSDLDGTELGH